MKKFYILLEAFLEIVFNILTTFFRFLNGRFCGRVIIKPYRMIWRVIMWCAFLYAFITCFAFPVLRVWSNIVSGVNRVVWGF